MTPALALISDTRTPATETLAGQIRRLQHEAKDLASTHLQCLEVALATVRRIGDEVADGGDAYPPGVRDIARRIASECGAQGLMLRALVERVSS